MELKFANACTGLRNFCGGEHDYSVSTKVSDDGSCKGSLIHYTGHANLKHTWSESEPHA